MIVKYAIKLSGTDYYYNYSNSAFSYSPELFNTEKEARECLAESFQHPDSRWRVVKFSYTEEEI